ncbi:MAG: TonB-dependent receptor [Bacteroidetes bacterium]|nr:TonB-dependent receptor [Bacteroidota bacterium]
MLKSLVFLLGSFVILPWLHGQSIQYQGVVFDSETKKPIEFASVSVLGKDSSILAGTVTDENGKFQIKSERGNINIFRFQFMGYESLDFKPGEKSGNLPAIYLTASVNTLEEITVNGERKTQTIQIDKQVFDTKQFQNTANGTGLDLISRLPSVTVNVEGEILLRGSASFLVLIDGKPTQRTASEALAQLPANIIEKIELITSPSAKYDADGKAGIVNIITKKNQLIGWSLVANGMSGGREPLRYGSDFLANYTGTKANFFFGADYRRFDIEGFRIGEIRTILKDSLTFLPSEGIRDYKDHQFGIRSGLTYTPTKQDILNVNWYMGEKQTDRTANLHYEEFLETGSKVNLFHDSFGSPFRRFFNQNLFVRKGSFQTVNADYTRNFANKGKITLTGVYEYSVLGGPLNNIDENEDNKQISLHERSEETSPLTAFRWQIDYQKPLGDQKKLELGYQFRSVHHAGTFIFENLHLANNTWQLDPEFNDKMDLRQQIFAGYANLNGVLSKWNYNVGLRAEYMDRLLTHQLGKQPFVYEKLNFFPSVQFLRLFNNAQSLRIAYNRRIDRPTTKLMSPFKNHRHAETIELGDPDLKPELAEVFEIAFSKTWSNVELTAMAYFNYTKDKVFRVNDIYSRTILWRTYTNAGTAISSGLETSLNIKLTSWWKLYASGNIFQFYVRGNPNGIETIQQSLNFNANGNTTLDLTKSLRFQWDATYIGRSVTPQGADSDYFLSNLGLKYSFRSNKVNVGLQIQNVFNSNIQTIVTQASNFYSTTDYIKYDRLVLLSAGIRLNDLGRKNKVLKTEYGEKEF